MKVIAWDTRVSSIPMTVSEDRVNIIVYDNTPLQYFINEFNRMHARHGNFEKLRIKCHGIERTVSDDRTGGTMVIGGFGLQFCQEGINLGNVETLYQIRDKVSLIAIPACRAAHSSPAADGMRLMQEIARQTNATVMASPHLQIGSRVDGATRVGEWEGYVWTFNPDGTYSLARDDHHPIRTEGD